MSEVYIAPRGAQTLDSGTPLWWLWTLEQRLLNRQGHMLRMDNFYRGDHPFPFLTRSHDAKLHDEFQRLLEESKSNFMRLVVDATEERLGVEGFRLSPEHDAVSDAGSWELWQANQMDAQVQTAFLESLVKGVSYLSVWADDDEDGFADIAVEDPLQTIVGYEGGSNYRRRECALKVWLDEFSGKRRANVYLPEGIYKYEAASDVPTYIVPNVRQAIEIPWAPIAEGFVENPLQGVIPIVPLRNRPRLLAEGESELEDVYRIQGQINGFVFLLALAGYFGAHRQRWAVGLKIMEDSNGKPVEPFDVAIDRLITSEDPKTTFGEFGQTDLKGYIDAIEEKVLHIAVITRTPRHYLIQQGQSPSGDAIQSAESGLVKKVQRKQRTFGEGLEEAMRLARLYQGKGESPIDSEIVWADPQTHSPGAITDSVVKQYFAGLIPKTIALERLGYSQTQIRQISNAAATDFAPEPAANPVIATAQRSDALRNAPGEGGA